MPAPLDSNHAAADGDDALAGAIAIVGMAGRFPGADDLDAFWDNLRHGREAVVRFSDEQLRAAGVPPEHLAAPNFVRAGAVLRDIDAFDAAFFGLSPREAALTDPQHRLFLECAWEALEDAGHVPDERQRVGVYAGAGLNSYLLANVLPQAGIVASTGVLPLMIANKADFMPSKLSYRLGLSGPSMNVNTACSTSLVAVHVAARALQGYECDVALAGGVTLELSGDRGYLHQAGGVTSAAGRCRAFDAAADGTVCGSGAGAVVLMRLDDALAGGYRVYAVVRGSAVNNDGSAKAGYAAPGVAGQRDVIATAIAIADVDPASIGYVEAHGTGTVVGDPIEVRALTEAFRMGTAERGFCAIGSVKTNIGHLDAAAGVASLIKTSLCMHHGELVPSLGYEAPNPAIDFASTPFRVQTAHAPWPAPATGHPRRAGVSSFGIGGTNAHVVLEQAPAAAPSGAPQRPWQLLTLSARTPAALDAATRRLADHLEALPSAHDDAAAAASLADVAHTLQRGRRAFEHRRAVVARSPAQAVAALRDAAAAATGQAGEGRRVVFVLPGIGDQYVGMGRELYLEEPVFRAIVDDAAECLKPLLGEDLRSLLAIDRAAPAAAPAAALDLRALMRGTAPAADPAEATLRRTRFAHPALFVIEYATASLLMSWGVQPAALVGHSLGEYTAACLAGVMAFGDALRVVAGRAALIDALPGGRMLAVADSAANVRARLPATLSLAADNAPASVVVAGPAGEVEAYAAGLRAAGVVHLQVASDHAFHSASLEPVRDGLAALLASVPLRAPAIPCISNLTGTWMTAAEAVDPQRWAAHSCATVAFDAGIATLRAAGHDTFLEVGPGQTLSAFVQQHVAQDASAAQAVLALPTLPGPHERGSASTALARAAAALWCAGAWDAASRLQEGERRRRVSLPRYPFERQRHWIDAPAAGAVPAAEAVAAVPGAPVALACRWTPAPRPPVAAWPSRQSWLVFLDDGELGPALCRRLREQGQRVVSVRAGREFARTAADACAVAPASVADFAALAGQLQADGAWPDQVVHLWGLTGSELRPDPRRALERGYASLLAFGRAFGADARQPMALLAVSDGVQAIDGSEAIDPAKAAVLGPCRVLPLEFAHLAAAHLDLRAPQAAVEVEAAVDAVLHELAAGLPASQAGSRGRWRWTMSHQPLAPATDAAAHAAAALRPGARALVVNYGTAPGARALAADIARRTGGPLDLVCDVPLPARADWARTAQAGETPAALRELLRDLIALESQAGELTWFASAATDGAALAAWLAGRPRPDLALHVLPLPQPQLVATLEPSAGLELQATAERAATVTAWLERTGFGSALFVSPLAAATGQAGLVACAAAEALVDALAQRLRDATGRPVSSVHAAIESAASGAGLAQRLAAARARGALAHDALGEAWPDWLRSGEARIEAAAGDPRRLREALRAETLAVLAAESSTGAARGMRPAYAAPDNEFEAAIAGFWEELFGIRPVGRSDHFFALGGSSLLAVQLVARLRERYQVDIGLAALFRSPTVSGLAQVLEDRLLAELEGMDDAEVERRLAATEPAPPAPVPRLEPTDLRLPDGLVVRQFNRAETEHFHHDIFQERVYASHGVRLPADAVVLDVGANIGLFSLFVHRECAAPRIVAFEPAPAVFAVLQSNLRAHGVNAEALNCGVGARSGRMPLTFYPLSTGMSSFHADEREEREVLHAILRNQWERGEQGMDALMPHVDELLDQRFVGEVVDCEIRTLSEVIDARGLDRVDLLKIDVQKSEQEVLEGLEPRHWPLLRQIVIEVHDIDGRVAAIGQMLRARGFDVTVQQELLYQQSNISILYGIRQGVRA